MAIRPRTRIMFGAKFQSFEEAASSSKGAERLRRLRADLDRRGLDGFVVGHADPHQNEYLPPSEERLAWLTGFTGSAGVAILLKDKAALFVDGRYTLQARKQVDTKAFKIEHLIDRPPDRWLVENLKEGATLGYDPWRTTHRRRGTARQGREAGEGAASSRSTTIPSTPSGPTGPRRRSGGSCCIR